MSASPSSPSKRRQQSGQSAQPQPIAPAPASTANQPIAPAPVPASAAAAPSADRPAPINTDAANSAITADAAKSPVSPTAGRKRKAGEMSADAPSTPAGPSSAVPDAVAAKTENGTATLSNSAVTKLTPTAAVNVSPSGAQTVPPVKKSRTNTPWTPAEERRLKTLRDAGSSWGEIAKEFPNRTEGSVKKHWYKDMHYADFAEDESAALLAAIREYESNKWKEIGKKVGKPAKACEQYAKENFQGRL